jgi:hypothetical protein
VLPHITDDSIKCISWKQDISIEEWHSRYYKMLIFISKMNSKELSISCSKCGCPYIERSAETLPDKGVLIRFLPMIFLLNGIQYLQR